MAKKSTASTKTDGARKSAAKPVTKTAVRNTPIPKASAAVAVTKRPEVSFDQISVRAYEIHISGNGGSELDNWFQAERELRGTV